jgi:hypothetical protein
VRHGSKSIPNDAVNFLLRDERAPLHFDELKAPFGRVTKKRGLADSAKQLAGLFERIKPPPWNCIFSLSSTCGHCFSPVHNCVDLQDGTG